MASILELAKEHQESLGTGLRMRRQKSFGSQSTSLDTWPMKSMVLGCTPQEIPKMRKFLRSRGVEAEFTSRGECIVKSEKHKKAIARARGMFDYNGGYDSAGPTQMHKDLRNAQLQRKRERFMKLHRRVVSMLMARHRR